MRKTRLITAFILTTAILAGSLAGCGKKPGTETPEASEESTETPGTDTEQGDEKPATPAPEDGSDSVFNDEEHAYKLDTVLVDDLKYCDVAYNDDCFAVGASYYDEDYEYGDNEAYPDGFLTLDVTFYDYTGREIGGFVEHNDSSDSYYNFNMDSKGNVYMIHSITNYDDRGYFTAYELLGYNKKGEIIDSAIFEDADDDFRVKDILIDSEDRLVAVTNEGFMTFKNREISDRIKYDDAENFADAYPMANGDMLLRTYGVEDMEISTVNFDSRKRKDLGDTPFSMSSLYSVDEGDDCDLILCGDNGIYKYNAGDSDYEKVMSLPMVDNMIDYLNDIRVAADGTVYGSFYDIDTESYAIGRFVPDDQGSDTRERITFGCVGTSDDLARQIYKFNKENKEYKVVLHDYSRLDITADYVAGNKALEEDLKNGRAADVVLLGNSQPLRLYMSKEYLQDLKPFIEADPEYDIDDYAPNVIEAMSMNGKLYMFSPDFAVNTAICKSAYMNESVGNKLSDFLNTSDWTGASIYTDDNTRGMVFYNIMRSTADDYINWEDLTCDFESTEFQKILSYANTYPKDYNYNYDSSHEGPYNSYPLPYRDGKALCEIRSLYSVDEYIESKQGVFGDNVCLIGFPTKGKVGSSITSYNNYAITSNCADKEVAWEFVRRFFDPDIVDEMYTNLPTSKVRLEKAVKDAGGKYKNYTDENEYTWEDPQYLVGSEYVQLKPLSKKDGDALLNEIYKVNRLSADSDEIYTILTEESEGYFMGAYDAATAAKSVQERVTEYLNSFK